MKKSETLKYYGNLSPDSVNKMKEARRVFITTAQFVESLGESRELSAAFTAIEHALMLVNKHICVRDPQAVQEDPFANPIPMTEYCEEAKCCSETKTDCCKETEEKCCGDNCTMDSTLADASAA